MKVFMKYSKMITLFLGVLILCQSCRAYHWGSVSLEEAVSKKKRVKIKTKDRKTLRYKQVIYEDGKFYGLKRKDKIEINPSIVQRVKAENKTMTIVKTAVAGFFGVVFTYFLCCWSPNLGVGGFTF